MEKMIRWRIIRRFKNPSKHQQMLEEYALTKMSRELDIKIWLEKAFDYNQDDECDTVKMKYDRRLEELEYGN